MGTHEVIVETGSKRAFATAVSWPGWSRSGRDPDAALDALVASAPRYRAALGASARGFSPPRRAADLVVVERLPGSATTDFGAPDARAAADAAPVDARELARALRLLRACWTAFDAAAEAAGSVALRKGPRGGGRETAAIVAHVLDAEIAYTRGLGGSAGREPTMAETRAAFEAAIAARVAGEVADRGPRGGQRWSPRYAVRRSAWHALDHAWEIEDRSGATGNISGT